MRAINQAICICFVTVMLFGCSAKQPEDFTRVAAIQSTNPIGIGEVRLDALKQTARSLGAQAGLAWRAEHINSFLQAQNDNLDKIFNFNALLLDRNVLPPILTEARSTLNLDNNNSIRLADRDYKVEDQARFVTAAPTWRDYLLMVYKKPEDPDGSLLPKSSKERKVWNQYVAIGWNEGVEQADEIYANSLARLKRDFAGMLLYRKLYAQNIVSAPFVARAELGVTGNGDGMRINDRELRITALPQFDTNPKNWRPALPSDTNSSNSNKPVNTPINRNPEDNV